MQPNDLQQQEIRRLEEKLRECIPCQNCGADPRVTPPSGPELPIVKGALDEQERAERERNEANRRALVAESRIAALNASINRMKSELLISQLGSQGLGEQLLDVQQDWIAAAIECDQLQANVATLVEQLGEAERRCVKEREDCNEALAHEFDLRRAAERRLALLTCARKSKHAADCEMMGLPEATPAADLAMAIYDAVAHRSPAGAAQPVVEPRDETALRAALGEVREHLSAVWHGRESGDAAMCVRIIDEALATHAPQPAEPPAHEQLVRESLGNPSRCVYVGGEGWVSPERVCELADGIRRGDPYPWHDVTDHGDLLSTASPPDVTAPERARPCNHCGALPYQEAFPSGKEPPVVRGALDAQADAEHRLFAIRESIATWVSEHWHLKKMELLEGIRRAPIAATLPSDGTAPEQDVECERCGDSVGKAPALCSECRDFDVTAPERAPVNELRRVLHVERNTLLDLADQGKTHDACRLRQLDDALHHLDCVEMALAATRPPDGMPGEPDGVNVLDEGSDTFRHLVAAHGRDEALRRAALCGIHPAAAPPTVPGEPPWSAMYESDAAIHPPHRSPRSERRWMRRR